MTAAREHERWVRRSGGRIVYSDDDDHVRLVVRTLGIDEPTWARTVDHYADRVGAAADVRSKLTALGEAFLLSCNRSAGVFDAGDRACSLCSAGQLEPLLSRPAAGGPLAYGRCNHCGHAFLLSGAASPRVYERDDYYEHRDADGVGYDAYRSERSYRESKAARLFEWIERSAPLETSRPALLEVGSGFGFTRRAASARGWRTQGIDVSPAAARWAKQLYGFDTVTATLGEALDARSIEPRAWDLVLYQFVLEHVDDPREELRRAARATRPGGLVAFIVPSASAVEIDVFGSSYRSVRSDHLHLFSVASARACAADAGLTEVAHETSCSLHLLRGFLDPSELDELYRSDLGPDLIFLARNPCNSPSS